MSNFSLRSSNHAVMAKYVNVALAMIATIVKMMFSICMMLFVWFVTVP